MKTKLQALNSTCYHLYEFMKLHEYLLNQYPGIMMELIEVENFLSAEAKKIEDTLSLNEEK
jgi:hypothetical protein